VSDERRRISSGSSFEREIGYSRAVVDGDWIFVAGTTGFDYETMEIAPGFLDQVAKALDNVETALAEAGGTLADVVRVRYIVRDAAEFESCWSLLRERLGEAAPAATMIEAGMSDSRMRFEIELTARRHT